MKLVSIAALILIGCGGPGGGGDDMPDADPGPPDPQFSEPGNLVTISESRWGTTANRGDVWAAFSTNSTGFHTETMRAGSCRLLTSSAEYCQSVPCTGWCVDDVCQEYPTFRDAGPITTTGLSQALTLTFNSGYYAPDTFPVNEDLFDAGDPVSVTAQGAEFPGFTVGTTGVATLDPDLAGACDNEWHIQRGQDAVIRWSSPAAGSRVRLRIPSKNNGHGLPSLAVIECEGPDTGELRVPAALIDAMPDFLETDGCDGIACVGIDCPPSTIARYAVGTTPVGSETAVLRAESSMTFYVYDN